MVGRMGKATNWVDDVEEQRTLNERQSMWGEIPGKIVSYDAKAQTATVKPQYKQMQNGKPTELPELYEVPVRMARAGKGALTYPVAKDDYVTLRPQMRAMDNYHENEDGAAADARSFHISNMEAHLSGGESLKNPIKNFDDKNVHLRFDEEGKHGLRGDSSGKIQLEGNQIKLKGSQGDLMALTRDIAKWAAETNNRLKQEPSLVYRPDYAIFEGKFLEIMNKLSAMVVP